MGEHSDPFIVLVKYEVWSEKYEVLKYYLTQLISRVYLHWERVRLIGVNLNVGTSFTGLVWPCLVSFDISAGWEGRADWGPARLESGLWWARVSLQPTRYSTLYGTSVLYCTLLYSHKYKYKSTIVNNEDHWLCTEILITYFLIRGQK